MPTIPDYEITWLNEKSYKQKTIPRVDYRELNKFPIVDERLTFTKEDTQELEELYPQILEHDNTQYSYSGSLKPHTRPFLREQFTFDSNSNITKVTNGWGSIDYRYDEANRLIQKGLINYSYDNNGNLLTEELAGEYSKSYKYNHDNRMSEAVEEKYKWQSKLEIGYTYDSMGRKRTARRVKKVNGATHEDRVEHYSYDGMNLIREAHTILDSVGTVLPHKEINYRHVGSKLLYSDEYSNLSQQYRNELYYHTNTTDTLTMATNGKGHEVEKYVFDIYGTVLKGEIERANFIGYNSKKFNDATDGWQYEFREYLPGVKQFTTDDPIRSTTNWRTLTGGYNDPVNYVDLLGLDPAVAKEVVSDPNSIVYWAALLKLTSDKVITQVGLNAAINGGTNTTIGTATKAASGLSLAFLIPLSGWTLFGMGDSHRFRKPDPLTPSDFPTEKDWDLYRDKEAVKFEKGINQANKYYNEKNKNKIKNHKPPVPKPSPEEEEEEEEDDFVTVYHGTADNYKDIILEGLNYTRLPAYVSTDILAAEDAIYNKYEVQSQIIDPTVNGGIIASDIPRKRWEELLKNGSVKLREGYTGFGRNLNTIEFQLWKQEAINEFNQHRRPERKCNK